MSNDRWVALQTWEHKALIGKTDVGVLPWRGVRMESSDIDPETHANTVHRRNRSPTEKNIEIIKFKNPHTFDPQIPLYEFILRINPYMRM